MNNRTSKTPAQRPRLGFTLIELIVAIGAIAIIAVGIAAIFESVGRTVAGGRRVSNLNQFASLIERQMRTDFQAMTRDGVLVIRHQYADVDADGVTDITDNSEPDNVPLHAEQPADEQRYRRIDEILFFAKGDYSSARTPVVPGLNASSSEAMIYYGHGLRLDPIEDHNPGTNEVHYELPQVDDGRFHPRGNGPNRPFRPELALGYDDPTNPNKFASEWTLLRKLTVLATPSSSTQYLPDTQLLEDLGFTDAPDYDVVRDNDIQIGGQPAATSAFRTLAAKFPSNNPPFVFPADHVRNFGVPGGDRYPTIASGIIDVATTDLAEIRRFITDIGAFPLGIDSELDLFDPGPPPTGLLNDQQKSNLDPYDLNNNLIHSHAWMDDLFPTDRMSGARARYEDAFPDFVGLLTNSYPDDPFFPALQSYRIADQRALSSSVFVPRCSEFIIEYSFGQVVDNDTNVHHGQLIWFGLPRELSIDGSLPYEVVNLYPFDTTDPINPNRPYSMPYNKLDGTPATEMLESAMLYGNSEFTYRPTAHFGYHDPIYTPGNPNTDPATIPWPWPKLIRITMTLADPVDPSIEQTFQFIFETPEADAF